MNSSAVHFDLDALGSRKSEKLTPKPNTDMWLRKDRLNSHGINEADVNDNGCYILNGKEVMYFELKYGYCLKALREKPFIDPDLPGQTKEDKRLICAIKNIYNYIEKVRLLLPDTNLNGESNDMKESINSEFLYQFFEDLGTLKRGFRPLDMFINVDKLYLDRHTYMPPAITRALDYLDRNCFMVQSEDDFDEIFREVKNCILPYINRPI